MLDFQIFSTHRLFIFGIILFLVFCKPDWKKNPGDPYTNGFWETRLIEEGIAVLGQEMDLSIQKSLVHLFARLWEEKTFFGIVVITVHLGIQRELVLESGRGIVHSVLYKPKFFVRHLTVTMPPLTPMLVMEE